MKVLVLGARGQLGSEISKLACQFDEYAFTFCDIGTLDLTQDEEVRSFFQHNAFDFIINCAAYTAVDKAEDDKEQAYLVNCQAVQHLLSALNPQETVFVHVSTDYVFDGNKNTPYCEEDSVSPLGVYGSSKLAGEKALLDSWTHNAFVFRTSWLYSSFGANFVKTISRLGQERKELSIVADQVGSPTYAEDLARGLLAVLPSLKGSLSQIYHFANSGVCSWYDIAVQVIQELGLDCKVTPISSQDYPTRAHRPHYSVLWNEKFRKSFQLEIPYWRDSLVRCLECIKESIHVAK